jgi:uncharacterized membrane protein (UPF0127 family)
LGDILQPVGIFKHIWVSLVLVGALFIAVIDVGLAPARGEAMPVLSEAGEAGFEFASLTIEPLVGDTVMLRVELALSQQQQAQGLMFRKALDDNAGMLFIFERVRVARFWMRNTFIPLDIVFIDPSGEVIAIETRLDTQSDAMSIAPAPVWGVLELKAGRAAELGILQGSRVDIKAFSNARVL